MVESFLESPGKCAVKDLVVSVIGAGQVGLTHACVFAEKGFRKVWMVDISSSVVDSINSGNAPFYEPGLSESLKKSIGKNLFATTKFGEAVSESDIISVSVGTPLNVFNEPDITGVMEACKTISRHVRPGALLILGSTVPVGTTSKVRKMLPEGAGLAFCPERMFEGTAVNDVRSMPYIIGAIDKRSGAAANHFFSLLGNQTVRVSSPEAAEMAKLLCNAYRAANIALGNEFAMICGLSGLDAGEVFEAANTSHAVRIMRPGMMGGSCLIKDPYFLTRSAMSKGIYPKIMLAAMELNEGLPHHVLRLIVDSLGDAGKQVTNSKIAILGAAFKGNTSDMRQSPVIPLVKFLKELKPKELVVYDPHVPKEKLAVDFGDRVKIASNIDEALEKADCCVIGAEHDEFKILNWPAILQKMNKLPIVVDAKGLLKEKIDGCVKKEIGTSGNNQVKN